MSKEAPVQAPRRLLAMIARASRSGLLFLSALGVAAVLAFAAVVLWARPVQGTTQSDELPLSVPLAVDKQLGVNTDLSLLGPLDREATMSAMQAAGLRWLRQRFPWDAIEPEPGVYQWAIWDEIVDAAARHNLALIAVLDGSPVWARAEEDAENPEAPPSKARDFGAFVAAFTGRYRDRIDYYQIWDEPNIAPHWGARWVDPAAYGQLLREGAIQVRAADPEGRVLLAALAPNVEAGGANMSELQFLEALYQLGADEWFDVVAVQLYVFDEPLAAPPDGSRLNWARAALVRRVMVAHGDAGTAVWAVSFGLGGAPAEDAGMDLAQAVGSAVAQARQNWPWLGPMLWAAWSPDDVRGAYSVVGKGVTGDGALDALHAQAVVAQGLAWPGGYPANHPSGQVLGGWRVTPSGADIGQTGDRLLISFWGSRLDLRVRRGDYRAFLFVSVDGQPANALPTDQQGRAYLVLYDPLDQESTVTLARGLPEGNHEAQIVAEGGWDQWAVVGWVVSREEPTRSLGLPTALMLSALTILALAARTTWPRRKTLLTSLGSLIARYRTLDVRLTLALTAGAALVTYFVVGAVPSMLSLVVLAVLVALRPEMGLPLIAAALPFYQPGKPLFGKVFSLVEILSLLTAAGWLLNLAWERIAGTEVMAHAGVTPIGRRGVPTASTKWRLSALDWGVLALVLLGGVSLVWSEQVRVAVREYRTVILEGGLFYLLLRVLVRERRDVWRVVDAWVLGGLAVSLIGVYQWAFGQNLITAEGVGRVRGFYGSPNNLALYLGRLLPLAIAVAAWGRAKGRRWFYGLAALAMATAVVLTYSRGAWLLGVPAGLLFLAALRGRRVFLGAFGVLAAAGLTVVLVVGPARLTSLVQTPLAGSTAFVRLQLWQSSWAMIRDHPILGVGLDNFLYAYRTRYVLPNAWQEFNLSHPHNFVLDFWLRLGLAGLAILGVLLVSFFRSGWRAYRRLADGDDRLLVMGVMAGMVCFLAHGLVDNAFFLVDLAFVFMLMIAVVQTDRLGAPG